MRTLRLASITAPVWSPCAPRRRRAACPAGPAAAASGRGHDAAGRRDGMYWARADAGSGAGIAAAAAQRVRRDGAVRIVQRMAAYAACGRGLPCLHPAVQALKADAGL